MSMSGTLNTDSPSATIDFGESNQRDHVIVAAGNFDNGTLKVQHKMNDDQDFEDWGEKTLTDGGSFAFYVMAAGTYQLIIDNATTPDVDYIIEPLGR